LFDLRSPHLDITRSESWILTGISRRREGISQTELAKVLGLGKVATGEFVVDLERRGLIVRRLQADDRRRYRVRLTPRGRTMLAKISAIVSTMNAEIFADFANSKLEQFADSLKKMKLQLIVLVDPPPDRISERGVRIAARRTRVAVAPRDIVR